MGGANNIKYLGITLTKNVNDLYHNNFKSLKTENEEDIIRWKDPNTHESLVFTY